jgi:hypothetical protein
MIYFSSVLLWISPHSVEIRRAQNIDWPLPSPTPLLIVLEEFNLAKALLCFFARLVWTAEILAALLRNHFVATFYFFDHSLPSFDDSASGTAGVNTVAAVWASQWGCFCDNFPHGKEDP